MHDESGTSTFTFRPFDPAQDFPALVALINAIDAVDQSGEATSEEQQRAQVAWPGRDLPRDRWLTTSIADPDQLLGFGDSWKMPTTDRADIYVGVHPAWRRHGLGRELLSRTLARAHEQGATSVAVYADRTQPAAHPFLLAHGFQVAGAYHELRAPIPPSIPAPQWPTGYTLHRFSDLLDVTLVVQALNRSYDDLFGHKIVTEADVRRILTFTAPDNVLLLFDPVGIAGICRVQPNWETPASGAEQVGYLDAGLVPTHRQPPIYRALVLAGLQRLREHEQREVVIESFSEPTPAITSYQELGFAIRRHSIAYQHTIA